MNALRDMLRRIAASRWLLLATNVVIVVITIDSMIDMMALATDTISNLNELENTSDAVATIYIAYGVAAEERASLMSFSGVYPALHTPSQDILDHASHYYGLSLLVIGLFMEIGVQLIKLPDRIINTAGIELGIFAVNALFMLLGLWLFFRYSLQIWRCNAAKRSEELPDPVLGA